MIMGCGRVGSSLTKDLQDRGHSTSVIDQDPNAFRRLGPEFAGTTVTGVGFDRDVLGAAGIDNADAFAAVSSGDNSNIIAARVAREQFGIENVVARIYDPGRAEVYERLGIPTVATVRWAADQVLRRILPAGSEPQWRDPSGHVQLDARFAPDVWVGHTISELEDATDVRVAFYTRRGHGQIASDSTIVQDGDFLSYFVNEGDVENVNAVFDNGPSEG